MKRVALIGALVAIAGGVAVVLMPHKPALPEVTSTATSVTAAGVTLTDASVVPPTETATWGDSAAERVIGQHCIACHSPELIRTQPPLNAEKWAGEIKKMREVYKAAIDPADDAAIVAALTALPGQVQSKKR